MGRDRLKSRLGFILISAGCAIGIGNVWKFPYMAGLGGGGCFVLFYLIFLAILGLPILTMEFSIGRASQKSPVKAYEELEKEGLIRSVAGKGFYVCEYNTDYLKEKQLMMLEKRLTEVIAEAKQAGLNCEQLVEMVEALF